MRCVLGAGQSQIRRLIQNTNQKRIITVFIGQRLGWQRMRFSFYLLARHTAACCLVPSLDSWLPRSRLLFFLLCLFFARVCALLLLPFSILIKCAWPLFLLLVIVVVAVCAPQIRIIMFVIKIWCYSHPHVNKFCYKCFLFRFLLFVSVFFLPFIYWFQTIWYAKCILRYGNCAGSEMRAICLRSLYFTSFISFSPCRVWEIWMYTVNVFVSSSTGT